MNYADLPMQNSELSFYQDVGPVFIPKVPPKSGCVIVTAGYGLYCCAAETLWRLYPATAGPTYVPLTGLDRSLSMDALLRVLASKMPPPCADV